MLRSIIFGFIISIITLTCGAQTLKQVDGGFEAMLPLLEKAGYKVYSFDLAPLSDSTYQIQFIIRRYVDGELENENAMPYTIQSRTMLSQFSEEARAEVTPEQMADAEKGIYSLSPRIDIGFMPAVDSLCNVMLNVVNQGSITMPLKLKELTNRKENEKADTAMSSARSNHRNSVQASLSRWYCLAPCGGTSGLTCIASAEPMR